MNRGDKIYLDKENTIESCINQYLACRDGIVRMSEYYSDSGYGLKTRIFLCKNTKHETVCVVRQTINLSGNWIEEYMIFDSDSFELFKALINETEIDGGTYSTIRDYNYE